MSSYWGIILVVVLILIWIIAGGYITQANIKIRGFEGNDQFFRTANNYAFWAAFITWFLVALFILLIILAVAGVVALFSSGAGEAGEAEAAVSEEETTYSKFYKQYQKSSESSTPQSSDDTISWSTIIILFFAFVLVGITGILSALAAHQLTQSHLFSDSDPNMVIAYDDCIIAAIICLGTVILIILGVIFYFIIGYFEKSSTDVITIDNAASNVNPVPAIKTNSSVVPVIKTNSSVVPVIKTNSSVVPVIKTNSSVVPVIETNNVKSAHQAKLEEKFKKGTIVTNNKLKII